MRKLAVITTLLMILLTSSCSTFTFKKPVAGKDCGWDGVSTFQFKSNPILDCKSDTCTAMSQEDYTELVKLIKSCRVWNHKLFEESLR